MHALTATGYAAKEPTHAPPWHALVVWDVFFNALATGLFLVAAVGELARPTAVGPAAVWAYPLALVLLLTDLTFLVLDLGDMLRFHHMLRMFKPGSPMSLGTWCLTLFSFSLTPLVAVDLLAMAGILPRESAAIGWVRLVLLVVALPFAFGSMAYKGVLFSTSAQPGWKDARWLGAYHVASAFALGGVMLLGLATAGGFDQAVAVLTPVASALLLVQLVPLALLVAELRSSLARRCTRGQVWVAVVLVLGGGVVLPLTLLAVGGTAVHISAAAAALVGCWVARRIIVLLPHTP